MGHAEEDKELMMIRMETLKTMIGKLKTKTNQATAKENSQSSSTSTDEKPAKCYFDRTKPSCTTRPTTLTTQVSPSSITSKSNKSRSGTSTPPTPKRILYNNASSLPKIRTIQNLVPVLDLTGQSSSSHSGSIAVPSTATVSFNHTPSSVPTATSLPLSATSLRILKINSLIQIPNVNSFTQIPKDKSVIQIPKDKSVIQIPKDKSVIQIPKDKSVIQIPKDKSVIQIPKDKSVIQIPKDKSVIQIPKDKSVIQIPKDKSVIQTATNVTESKIQVPPVSKIADQPSLNKNNSISTGVPVKTNKPSIVSSSSKHGLIKSSTMFSKSYSDSEILLRKNLLTKYKSCNETASCRPSFISVASKSSSVFSPTVRPASTGPVQVSLINNHTRPSSLLLKTLTHKPIKTVKTTEHNSLSIALQKTVPTCSTAVSNIKPVNKPPSASRPPTHTITRPDKHRKPITSTALSSAGPALTTVGVKKQASISSASKLSTEKPIIPQTGKILFERTGKVLFDRHAGTQNKTKFQAPSIKTRSSNHLLKTLKTKPTANFAHEFQLIREKHASAHVNTTRTKFFSTEYIPPEMSKKARVILSKYKVVRNKDPSNVPVCNSKINDGNVTYSSPTTTSNVANVPGKILFQRYKPTYARNYSNVYSKKGKIYPRKPNKNFVSRRIKYIKRVDPSPFSLQVKPPVEVTGAPNSKAKKEIILSRHGTSYKVAGNLKSLRRLSSEKGHKSKITYAKPITSHSKYHLCRSTSKQNARSVSVKQYAASQVLKKTIVLTARKKVTDDKYCLFYNRFGKCKRGDKCKFIHDADKIAICTRFLRGTCKDENCLFSHKLDPDKMPVCSYFLRGECSRDSCPYRHVKVSQSASVCDDFLKGYCPRGKECTKKHILECEEFMTTGSCSKGNSCLLTHRQGHVPKRKNSGSRPPKGLHQKRKKVEENNEEGATNGESNNNSNDNKSEHSRQNKAKKHKLPKFVSEKIKLLRESTSVKPASFAGIKKLMESTTPTEKTSPEKDAKSTPSKDDFWNSDFIPLSNYSSGESDDEDSEFIQRMFTFK